MDLVTAGAITLVGAYYAVTKGGPILLEMKVAADNRMEELEKERAEAIEEARKARDQRREEEREHNRARQQKLREDQLLTEAAARKKQKIQREYAATQRREKEKRQADRQGAGDGSQLSRQARIEVARGILEDMGVGTKALETTAFKSRFKQATGYNW